MRKALLIGAVWAMLAGGSAWALCAKGAGCAKDSDCCQPGGPPVDGTACVDGKCTCASALDPPPQLAGHNTFCICTPLGPRCTPGGS